VVEWADVSVGSKAGVSNTLPPVLAAAGVYDGQPSYTVSIMEFRDGKVVRETQYFGDPFEPALREFNGLSGFNCRTVQRCIGKPDHRQSRGPSQWARSLFKDDRHSN
jgi:hypothetical protein